VPIDTNADAEWQGAKPTRDSVLANIRAGRRNAVAEAALLSYSDMIGLGLTSAPAAATPAGFEKFYTEAGPRPTHPARAPAVTAADRAKVRAIAAKANEADAREALLTEIQRKHGPDAMRAARDLPLADLLKRAASPTRAEIAASWEKVFRARGIELQHEDDPTETPIQQSWSRAFARLGFKF
jgi:hypothetical protein